MTKQTIRERKKPGPAPTGKGVLVGVRLQPRTLSDLDSWAFGRPELISRPEAIRRLLEASLAKRDDRRRNALTPEERLKREHDEDSRTTEVGLYHFAVSYQRAADALRNIELPATHPAAPQEFLYYHAIELFLKAFLRNSGLTVRQLRGFGHHIDQIQSAYLKHGGELTAADREVLATMAADDNVIRSRYIVSGVITSASLLRLSETAESLRKTVRHSLKAAGKPVR